MPPRLQRRFKEDRPLFVRDNINSIHDICNTLHITYGLISRYTGIPSGTVFSYADYGSLPGKRNYNKLAAFFDWEEWT